MGIFSFNEFIVERLGVSEASLLFVDTLEARAVGIFESFIKSDEKQLKITEIIDYRILRPLINRNELELYSKFPVIKFELEIDFKILNEKEWSKKYPSIARSWIKNWANIAPFLTYPGAIRKIMYTTNMIESVNRCIRKITKNRTIFPHDEAVFKLVYLALRNLEKNGVISIFKNPRAKKLLFEENDLLIKLERNTF